MNRPKKAIAGGIGLVLVLAAAAALMVTGAASSALFGAAMNKGCNTPINVGDPYTCDFEFLNVTQQSHNTLTVKSLKDTVNASGGAQVTTIPINSSTPGINPTGAASCDATKCTVPYGSTLEVNQLSSYTAQPADFPTLSDDASFTYNNSCNVVSTGCSTADATVGANATADINPLDTTTVTHIHNAAHQVVTASRWGSTVHDFVTVTGQPGRRTRPAT